MCPAACRGRPGPGAALVNHNCSGVPDRLGLLTAALLTPAAKDKGEKKLFGYSFVPLMKEDGRTLPDGTHELIIHKVTAAFSTGGPSLSRVWFLRRSAAAPDSINRTFLVSWCHLFHSGLDDATGTRQEVGRPAWRAGG